MSVAHIMNVSQTNNAILINRVHQLANQVNQLNKLVAELEAQNLKDSNNINNYAKQFTTNSTSSTKTANISDILPDAASWKAQECQVKNITITTSTDANEGNKLVRKKTLDV